MTFSPHSFYSLHFFIYSFHCIPKVSLAALSMSDSESNIGNVTAGSHEDGVFEDYETDSDNGLDVYSIMADDGGNDEGKDVDELENSTTLSSRESIGTTSDISGSQEPETPYDSHLKLYDALFRPIHHSNDSLTNDDDCATKSLPEAVLAVERLLKKGVDINAVDDEGRTVLNRAAETNADTRTIRYLLLRGADRWKRDKSGSPPLSKAVVSGVKAVANEETVMMLVRGTRRGLEKKSIPELEIGSLDIGWATGPKVEREASSQDVAAVSFWVDLANTAEDEKLESTGQDKLELNTADKDGKTVLHLAVKSSTEGVRRLLRSLGADNMKKDRLGYIPLVDAIRLQAKGQTIRLLAMGISLETRDVHENTPLHHAIQNSHFSAIEILIELGADIHSVNLEERAPIHEAIIKGNDEILQLLLQHKANPDQKDYTGVTPLMLSAEIGAPQLAKTLLAYGASMDLTDGSLSTALHYAVEWNQMETLEVLCENGADTTPYRDSGDTALHVAISRNASNLIWPLLDYGADIEAEDGSGRTPLLAAIWEVQLEAAKILLAAGANMKAELVIALSDFAKVVKDVRIIIIEPNPPDDREPKLEIGFYDRAPMDPTDVAKVVKDVKAIKGGKIIELNLFGDRKPELEIGPHNRAPTDQADTAEMVRNLKATKGVKLNLFDTVEVVKKILLRNTQKENGRQQVEKDFASIKHHLSESEKIKKNDTTKNLEYAPAPVSSHAIDACKGFQAVVVDILAGRLKENLYGQTRVYDLLYGEGPEAAIRIERKYGMGKKYQFRWHHLPANNVS